MTFFICFYYPLCFYNIGGRKLFSYDSQLCFLFFEMFPKNLSNIFNIISPFSSTIIYIEIWELLITKVGQMKNNSCIINASTNAIDILDLRKHDLDMLEYIHVCLTHSESRTLYHFLLLNFQVENDIFL